MKQDPTIGEFFQRVRSAPRRLLDVRVSTIWNGFTFWGRIFLLTVTYAAIVLVVGYGWHLPGSFYVLALVLIPLPYIREWWRERKMQKAGKAGMQR